MSNFYLTPQYELFVEAKKAFIKHALMPRAGKPLDYLQDRQIAKTIELFTEMFSHHDTPFGSASGATRSQESERTIYNAHYALNVLDQAEQALNWNSQQRSLSAALIRELIGIFQTRIDVAKKITSAKYLPSERAQMEEMWVFLMKAPNEVLTVLSAMRYLISVSPASWGAIGTAGDEDMNTGLLLGLYKDGSVWPNSPISFVPVTPVEQKESYYIVVQPGRTKVRRTDFVTTRMELIYDIMRELFGHLVTCKFVLPAGTDSAFAELTNIVKQVFGSWAGVPDWHFLHAIRDLLNDCRCTDNRRSYDGAKKVTLVTLLEFADAVRVYREGDREPNDINDVIQKFVELIVTPNMGFFNLLLDSYPAFSNHR